MNFFLYGTDLKGFSRPTVTNNFEKKLHGVILKFNVGPKVNHHLCEGGFLPYSYRAFTVQAISPGNIARLLSFLHALNHAEHLLEVSVTQCRRMKSLEL